MNNTNRFIGGGGRRMMFSTPKPSGNPIGVDLFPVYARVGWDWIYDYDLYPVQGTNMNRGVCAIPVKAGEVYEYRATDDIGAFGYGFCYDENKQYMRRQGTGPSIGDCTVTIPDGCAWFAFNYRGTNVYARRVK